MKEDLPNPLVGVLQQPVPEIKHDAISDMQEDIQEQIWQAERELFDMKTPYWKAKEFGGKGLILSPRGKRLVIEFYCLEDFSGLQEVLSNPILLKEVLEIMEFCIHLGRRDYSDKGLNGTFEISGGRNFEGEIPAWFVGKKLLPDELRNNDHFMWAMIQNNHMRFHAAPEHLKQHPVVSKFYHQTQFEQQFC